MTNLFMNILDAAGVPAAQIGDSNGKLGYLGGL
jgi:hypothetical protein